MSAPHMYLLEYLGSTAPGALLQPGERIPLTPAGLMFVGELRANQDPGGARIVALGDSMVTSGRHGHCRLTLLDDGPVLYDCGSDNGTWIARDGRFQRVGAKHSAAKVAAQSEIVIGRSRFRVLELPLDMSAQQASQPQ